MKYDAAAIGNTLELLPEPGGVWEMRIPKTREGTISGYFNSLDSALKAIAGLNGAGPGVYVTLNPINQALLARSCNRLKTRVANTTNDGNVTRRRWLPIDCDPVRPAEISSTDAEHEAALERCRIIRWDLAELGWSQPVLADSGNGGHLLFLIDLPNDAESELLVKRVLKALAARFDDAAVRVDQTLYNASRIVKLYGTLAAKGDNVPDRPHRLSRILDVPATIEIVTRELLEELAATIKEPDPPPRYASPGAGQFDIDAFVARYLNARPPVAHEGGRKWVLEACPFNPEHRAPDAAVFQRADGSLAFKCFHASCAGKGWRDVRALFDGPRSAPPPKADSRRTSRAGVLLQNPFTEVAMKPINWLWPGRIARGKVNLLAGNPGLGKSQVTISIAAVVSTGGVWPVDCTPCTQGSVVLLSAEDDPADTLRPRLEAAGADLSRVHYIRAVVAGYTAKGKETHRGFSLQQDVDALAQTIAEIGDVAAVVIDPVSAYLGDTDSHRNAEVRALLAPLAEVAARCSVSMILVSHLNKGAAPEALMRVTGSLAFVAAARSAYLIAADPDDRGRRLLLPLKNNLAPDQSGLAFRIEGVTLDSPRGPVETSRVMWEPAPVTATADEVLRPQAPAVDSSLREVSDWLRAALRDPMPAAEVFRQAREAGHTEKTIRRAADQLGVTKQKTAMRGGWTWSLGGRGRRWPTPSEDSEDSEDDQDFVLGDLGHLRDDEVVKLDL